MTLTEAVQFDEGAGGGRIYQQRLPAGMTEIFVSNFDRALCVRCDGRHHAQPARQRR